MLCTYKLSILIPAFNEAARLGKTLSTLTDWVKQWGHPVEILVVDDGSQDETRLVATRVAENASFIRCVSYPENQGKGFAVRVGFFHAQGDYVLLYDADGATAIEEIERLWSRVEGTTHTMAIGSRALRSPETTLQADLHRRIMGRVFNGLLFPFTRGIEDTQCGFKLFHRDSWVPLFQRQTIYGYAFDVELLTMARLNGYEVIEIPISWKNMPGSKVKLLPDSVQMLLSLWQIGWHHLQGYYRLEVGGKGEKDIKRYIQDSKSLSGSLDSDTNALK